MECYKPSDAKALIEVVKSAFGMEADSTRIRMENVQEITRLAKKQSILPVLIVGMEKMGKKELLSSEILNLKSKAIYDYHQRNDALNQICRAFDSVGIEYIPLKGSVLKDLYPEPWMRTSSDIDVLVRKSDIERATITLENQTRFKKFNSGYHDVHFLNEKVHLELHFSLLDNMGRIDDILSLGWNYAYREEDETHPFRCAFSPEFQIYYITAHACKHFVNGGGIGMRPLIDLWLLKTKSSHDESAVRDLVQRAGIEKYYDACSELLHAWFDNESYSNVSANLEEIVMSSAVFGSQKTRTIAKLREKKGVRYFFSRVFVSNKVLRRLFPICDKYPIMIPVCHVRRWCQLLIPSKRKRLRKELDLVKSINQGDIDRYDSLVRDLGVEEAASRKIAEDNR